MEDTSVFNLTKAINMPKINYSCNTMFWLKLHFYNIKNCIKT
jgi:hypothetical protein